MAEELLTPKELSEELKLALSTIYGWRTRGGGPPAVRVGGRLRYQRGDVDRWLAAQPKR